ncbi:MAG: type II toxin-antitoxin system HipA family toxin [Bacteroidetes bacterium]|nr:type II toxin-antitoxin system HipA family toxin [Bacteroidota bacterium]
MVNSAFVNIWGKRVGAISWNPNSGLGAFQYDSDFINTGFELSPIHMPLNDGRQVFRFDDLKKSNTFKGLPGLVADALPDKYGNALINAWLSRNGRPTDSLNPVEILCFIGKRAMGALEFEPVVSDVNSESTQIELSSLINIADEILNERKKFKTNLNIEEEKALFEILKVGSSAGGARAKALIAFHPISQEIRSGQANVSAGYEHWLIKLDGVMDAQFGASSGYGRVEMAYYEMAREAGITIAESRLLEENGRAHFMTKRFDRTKTNEKIHVQSFCALRHFDFNEVNLYSYESLFETMRMLRLSYPDAQEMFRRMVFNVLSKNCDDHTKNFGFCMDSMGEWTLSPAFDLCHAFRPNSPWVSQHALSINGKRKDFEKSDFLTLAKSMNIKNASEIIEQVQAAIWSWPKHSNTYEVPRKLSDAIAQTFVLL